MELDDIGGVGYAPVGHLGDMYESVLMDADIDKGSEVGDIGDDAGQLHAGFQVLDFMNIFVKLEFLELGARVAPRLGKFLHNVGQCGQTYLGRDEMGEVDAVADFLVEDIRQKVGTVDRIKQVDVKLVFEPEWTKDMMSEEAKLELGFL